jgi:DNA repair exonuclease SbcCD nuclease subunit
VISGNHDAANRMTKSLRLPKNPGDTDVMLSDKQPQTIVLDRSGVAIHGQGFAKASVDANVVPGYPPAVPGLFNIGLLHTSLDCETEGEHARYAPCRIADLSAKGYQYWALGHIHQRAIRHRDPAVVYPGNIQGRHVRELGEKGCMLVTVDDHGSPQLEFQPLDVFRWHVCEVDGSAAERADDVLDEFSRQLSRLVEQHGDLPMGVRVTVVGKCSAHEELVSNPVTWTEQFRARALDIGSGRVWVEKTRFRTTPMRELEESLVGDGPLGEILQFIHELRSDEEQLCQLGKDLDELRRKLPEELRHGPDGLHLDVGDPLRRLLTDVEPLLISRLLSREDGP